jgi:chaperonin GroES
MKFIPLYHRVLIEPILPEEKTKGGIILTNTDTSELKKGKVVAVGDGWQVPSGEIISTDVKVNDTVMFKHGFDEIKVNEKLYYLIKEDDIFGILEN